MNSIVRDDPNPFEQIFNHYADRLSDASGAAPACSFGRSAKRIREALLEDVAVLILRLDDVQLVGGDVAVHLFEIAYCHLHHAGAVRFVSALRERLQRCADSSVAASNARSDFRERSAWWGMPVARASELRK